MGSMGNDIVTKAEAILASAKSLKPDEQVGRMGLMKQVDSLFQELEPPINLFFKQWISITTFACMNIAINLGAFEAIETHGSMSAKQLAASLNADKEMHISRIMRVLVAAGVINSPEENVYSHTARSRIYVKGEHTAVNSFNLLTLLEKCYITLPDYLKSRPVSDLVNVRKSPYACAYGMEGSTFYEVLSSFPEHLDTFNRSMSEPGPDYTMYSFKSLKEEVEAEPGRPFVVDIGGGRGQALRYIQKETGNFFGPSVLLILQDRPEVIADIGPDELPGIEKMGYDFHTEQPIKGAHVYFLSQILHNYPDHVCQDILAKVEEAMSPASRLLILDAVLPEKTDVGGDIGGYLIDFVGLAISGKERTESQLSSLLNSVGLELVKVWPGKMMYQAITEVRLRR